MTADECLKQAQEELYTAIQAIEDRDLPFARSSSQRASGLIIEAWQKDRKMPQPELTQLTGGVKKGEIQVIMARQNVGRSVVANLLSPTDD